MLVRKIHSNLKSDRCISNLPQVNIVCVLSKDTFLNSFDYRIEMVLLKSGLVIDYYLFQQFFETSKIFSFPILKVIVYNIVKLLSMGYNHNFFYVFILMLFKYVIFHFL